MDSTDEVQEGHGELKTIPEVPNCPQSRPRLSPFNYGGIVNVTVGSGETQRTFAVHEGLLVHSSSYFLAALKDVWQIGSDTKGCVSLPDDEPTVFEIYFHWLYTGNLYTDPSSDGGVPIPFERLSEAYIFGDARGIPEFCNAAINVIFQKSCADWCFPEHLLVYVYQNTTTSSKLRKLLVDFAVAFFGWDMLHPEEFPHEFLINAILEAKSRNLVLGGLLYANDENLERRTFELCKYHDHSDPAYHAMHNHRN